MTMRIFNLLRKCSFPSISFVRIVQEPLPCQRRCLYHPSTVARYSTSSNHQSNQEDSSTKSTTAQDDLDEIKKKSLHVQLKEEGYVQIYKFQYAPLFAAINKVKWQQLYVTSGAVPLTLFCSSIGILSTSVPIIVLCIGSVITSTLWIFGAIFNRAIGAVLVSPDGQTVCISIVDGKGRRQDDLIPVKDLIPISDSPAQKYTSSWWILLQRYSETDESDEVRHQPYKMFVQNYIITDRKKFMEIFKSLL